MTDTRCPRCNYDLRNGSLCPECGAWSENHRRRPRSSVFVNVCLIITAIMLTIQMIYQLFK